MAEEQKVKAGALMPLLRVALSGQMRGPDVKVMMEILGRERVLASRVACRRGDLCGMNAQAGLHAR